VTDELRALRKRYVLPEIDDATFEQQLKALEKEHSDVELAFDHLDWVSLRREFGQMNAQATSSEGAEAMGGEVAQTALVPAHSSALVLSSVEGINDYTERVRGDVEARQDKDLLKAFQRVADLGGSLKDAEAGAADYFGPLLLPEAGAIQDRPVSWLQECFDSVLRFLKSVLSVLRKGVTRVWSELRKIDEYYLRLKGELELAREHYAGTPLAFILEAPAILKLYVRLLVDDRVPKKAKAAFAGGIAYLVSPIDFIPEFVFGPKGYVDDVVLMGACLAHLTSTKYVSRELLDECWEGHPDTLDEVLRLSNFMVNKVDFLRRIYHWFMGQSGFSRATGK